MIDLANVVDPAAKPKPKWLYRAERFEDWGISPTGILVHGLALVYLPEDLDVDPKYVLDPVGEEIAAAGSDCGIELPKEGLVEGQIYRAEYVTLAEDDWYVRVVPADQESR